MSPSTPVRGLAYGYVQLIQGTPLLVIVFLAYFGVPALGINVPAIVAAGASLTIYVSAYLGEIWRGCIEAVPRPQWEAAECLALSRTQRMVKVILPQASPHRDAADRRLPGADHQEHLARLGGGFVELARSGQIINNSLFEPLLVYTIIAAIYFAMCYPISLWSRMLERDVGFAPPSKLATP